MITGVYISPDGQELAVTVEGGISPIVVADPHEEYAELVHVEHLLPEWTEVYRRG